MLWDLGYLTVAGPAGDSILARLIAYDGIVGFSQPDFDPDHKKIAEPTLVMHGDDDQIGSYADSAA